jgi:hypothetical protein
MTQYRARGISRKTGREVWLLPGWRNNPIKANWDITIYGYLDLYTNIWIEIDHSREPNQRPTMFYDPFPPTYYRSRI